MPPEPVVPAQAARRDILRVLLIEDRAGEVRLIRELLADQVPLQEVQGVRFIVEHAERLAAALRRITAGDVDCVLLDLGLPDSQGLDTFVRLHTAAPDVPIVILSGLQDEELARQAVRQGAQDYIVKGQVAGELLVRALCYAVERQRAARAREALLGELQAALAQVRRLSGLLPICAQCKRIRDDRGYWQSVEQYVSQHSEAEFTHGICPACMRKLYPAYSDADDGPGNETCGATGHTPAQGGSL